MAYTNYYPATYQSPAYQPQYYQQPQYQPMQSVISQPQANVPQTANYAPQSVPAQTAQASIIWISGGEKAAAMYPVAPNAAVALWDQDSPVVYFKQADASGKPSMKVYDLVERQETPREASSATGGKTVEYATKSDLSTIVGVVQTYDEAIKSLRGELDKMSGDLYGLLGKKKAVAKKTEEVDE